MILLNNHSVIYIAGEQRKSFLQGLITNDVNKISEEEGNGIYAAMLSAQGRFLYDFFIIEKQDCLLLDCSALRCDEIIKKFSLYKLLAKIEIGKMAEFAVAAVIDQSEIDLIKNKIGDYNLLIFPDPRKEAMGMRLFGAVSELEKLIRENNLAKQDLNLYNQHRFDLLIADENDLTYDQSFINEYGFETLNAIDYEKGCYVGQELVARSHYRGQVRKRIYLIEIPDLTKIEKGAEIICEDKKIGVVLSSVFIDGKLRALALIKNIDNEGREIDIKNLELKINDNLIYVG